jgi:hypothetical protein
MDTALNAAIAPYVYSPSVNCITTGSHWLLTKNKWSQYDPVLRWG